MNFFFIIFGTNLDGFLHVDLTDLERRQGHDQEAQFSLQYSHVYIREREREREI
jgi:hypothetical protein